MTAENIMHEILQNNDKMKLKEACRACLRSGQPMRFILESIEPPTHSDCVVNFWKIFNEMLITHEDRIPDKICAECLEEIHQTYSFVLKCERSADILKKIKGGKVCLKKLKTGSLEDKNDISETIKSENDANPDISPSHTENIEWNAWEQFKTKAHASADNQVEPEPQDPLMIHDDDDNLGANLSENKNCEDVSLEEELEPHKTMENNECGDIEYKNKSSSESFICPACRYDCRTRGNLEKHIIENHIDRLMCKLCNNAFTCTPIEHCWMHIQVNKTEWQLKSKNVNEYKCEVCLKIFKCKFNLQQHLTIHTGERPFKCEICSKAFRQKYNLMRHLKGHMEKGEKKQEQEQIESEHADNQTDQVSRNSSIEQQKGDSFEIELMDPLNSKNDIDNGHEISIKHESELKMANDEIKFKCSACQYKCRKMRSLAKHTIIKHMADQMCKLCNKAFTCTAIEHCSTHLDVNKGRLKSKTIKPHKCRVCSKILKCKFNLDQHLKIHTGERPFKCKICLKTFRQKKNLTYHLKSHTESNERESGTCVENPTDQKSQDKSIVQHKGDNLGTELSFDSKADVSVDQFSQEYDKNQESELDMSSEKDEFDEIEYVDKFSTEIFICPVCRCECQMMESLEKHIIETHMEGQTCKICNKAFICTSVEHCSLHLHVNKTEGLVKFKNIKHHKCTVCLKIFRFKATLIRHSLTHTKEKPFKCEICPKTFTRKIYLKDHLRWHTGERPFKCEICTKTFRQKYSLSEHLKWHTGERPFKCEICSKTFQQRQCFREHIKFHTGERPFKCEICSKTFQQKLCLTQHFRCHTGENPFLCEICAKSFQRKGNLVEHLKCHASEGLYKCLICSKTFRQERNLTIHLRCHTGDQPFKCEICTKSFQQKHSLTDHLRCHTGERPFKCEICLRTFQKKQCLSEHVRRHRGERSFKCVICPKGFTDKRSLMKHLNRCHAIE